MNFDFAAEGGPADDNDVSSAYMQHAQNQSADATIERFYARMRPAPVAKPAKTDAEDDADAVMMRMQPAASGFDEPWAPWLTPRGPIGRAVTAIASDIGTGFIETPSAIGKGIYNATHSTVRALDDVANWLNENVADLRVGVPKTGFDLIDRTLANPIMVASDAMPDKITDKPKSVTGNVAYEGARFLTGFIPALRLLKSTGAGKVSGPLVAGGLSEFFTSDTNERNLTALLVQSKPEFRSAVTDYLATNLVDDPAALNRLRHAAEGVGFGAATPATLHAIRGVKA